MATCVELQPDGTLVATGQPVDQCAGYVMVSGSEYGVYQTLQTLLQMPTPEQAMGWFSGPCGIVVLCYMAAYFVGRVIAMFDTD